MARRRHVHAWCRCTRGAWRARAALSHIGARALQLLPATADGESVVLSIPPGTLAVGAKGDDVLCEISVDRVKMTADGKGMVLLP